jgi:flagellar hook-basal body complex protein FliE
MNEIGGFKNQQWMFPLSSERSAISTGGELSPKIGLATPPSAAGESSASFLDTLKGALKEVNETQIQADSLTRDHLSGKAVSLDQVMIAMQKADLSLKTAGAVRNKMVEAYNEIMRMQL